MATITINLTDRNNTPRASLSSLKWAFWDYATPDLISALPSAKGALESTDANGQCVLDVTGTTLSSGQTGWLILTNSTGAYDNTSHLVFSGPVRIT